MVLAGAVYVKPLSEAGMTMFQPMKGFSIGERIQWLNNENALIPTKEESHLPGEAGG